MNAHDCLDYNLLNSAAEQPFQGGFGIEFYPSLFDKAAYLFFAIAGGHIFNNGNKRTAVLALDQFLHANGVYLMLSNEEIKDLAVLTASYHERHEVQAVTVERIRDAIASNSVEFRKIRLLHPKLYRRLHYIKNLLRKYDCVTAYPSD